MKELAWVQAQAVAEVMVATATRRGAATAQMVARDNATAALVVAVMVVRGAMEALPIVAVAVAVAMA